MRVRIPKRTLAEAIGILERIIPNRSSNPVITQLFLQGHSSGLTLRGTNGEVDLELTVTAETEGADAFLVPAHLFGQIVRGLPGELVELSADNQELEVESGSFRTRLATATPEGYPELTFDAPMEARLAAPELARALAHVRYAASTEEYRAIFRGVQLEFHPGALRAVASDGFRLARYDLATRTEFVKKLVVPARSADEIIRVLKDTEGEVAVGVTEGKLVLASEAFRMSVALMEGEFPDYERVIPQQFVGEAVLSAEALRESIKRVKVLADKNNHRIDLFFQGDALEVVAEGDYGRGSERLSVQREGEPQLVLAYNAEYLGDALSPVEGQVRIRLSGPTSPTVIEAVEDPGYLAVVVPLRV
ncbi:DNA polymerase III subunit beta [Marinithermus hydrothermalis]|uniref:Beta sliding clamp n=1 Tax=Marinithermus hydrothermalis (strain DSM 14884 / JCM 11576 / T1) TaxID=869210 RepID=F2NNF7_MARHT|nr:DNA polymerase III subunit beta [Marinithermus hydrothermalis]AEB10767.1 DNA polymerase III, beta subunit [Marinithermus hydrothermalis DSM 14884]